MPYSGLKHKFKFKVGLNSVIAKLRRCAYLVPYLVLGNMPEWENSPSTYLLATSTHVQKIGIADPRADWAMISTDLGINKKN